MDIFTDYKVYGPYYHKRLDRYMVYLVSSTHRTSMTYARYLMCMSQKRILESWEQVDHIDGNRLNDLIENLQILTQKDNIAKSARSLTLIAFSCSFCGREFELEKRQIHKKRKLPICCSRSCSAKLQRAYTSVVRRANS